MTVYILRRILASIPLLLLLALGLFLLLALVPGDASSLYISPDFPPEYVEQIKHNLGLDQPLWIRLGKWFWSAMHLDFQLSLAHNRPVAEMIGEALPNTVLLSVVCIVLIFVAGVLIGVVSAVKQYSVGDHVLTSGSLFLYSMPGFWLALMLILLMSRVDPRWPSSGMTGEGILMRDAAVQEAFELGELAEPGAIVSFWERAVDVARHLVLPAIALGLALAAGVARYTRAAMLEVKSQDYVRTAHAKGVHPRRVVFRHTLRNALIPVVTLLGLYFPFLISGSVLIETIFAWPGMGRLIVTAVFERDVPVVMATSLCFATMVILGNLVSDVLYSVVDPRIRYD